MNRLILTLAVIALPISAHATTLAADSLLCESESIAKQADGSASKALGLARISLRVYVITKNGEEMDRAIRTRNSVVIDGMRQMHAQYASDEAKLKLAMSNPSLPAQYEPYRQTLLTCASSGADPVHVELLETRPISGVAKVNATFNGQGGVFWVKAASLAD